MVRRGTHRPCRHQTKTRNCSLFFVSTVLHDYFATFFIGLVASLTLGCNHTWRIIDGYGVFHMYTNVEPTRPTVRLLLSGPVFMPDLLLDQ